MKYLVIGAGGFLGYAIANNIDSKLLYLSARKPTAINCEKEYLCDICDAAALRKILDNDISVVIHCAARAHIIKDTRPDSLSAYREVNTHAALNFAKQAAQSGVRRFVFISSIGVNGSVSAKPFSELDMPNPHNDYALSKFEAEKGLLEIASKTDMDVVIIRPPLVYGPNPPGNFSTIIKLIKKKYPLPLDSITQNKRSLIALENLIDFILICSDYKKTSQAANQTFVISDGEDVSTAELFHRVAKAYGKKSRLFRFPFPLLRLGAKLLGKQDMADRLLGSLQVDSSKARDLLGWQPVITMEEQLRKMAEVDSWCG
jgi:nucleoside-diphosphate-sugar epimerase